MASQGEQVVAIDVGGTTMKGAVFDRQGRIWNETRRPTDTDRGAKAVIESILALAGGLVSPSVRPTAFGIAIPGLVRDSDGMVLEATNVGLRDVPLRELASGRLSSPVAVLHDVRAAALAEGTLGAARGRSDYLLLTLGTGVGAAVIIGGRPYTGAHGIGGELGHVAVDQRGPVCRCGGTGCLEAIASAGAVERRFGHGVDARTVADRAAAYEPDAMRVWREALDALALAIVNYATLLDPEVVVIGGGLANAGPGGGGRAPPPRGGGPPPPPTPPRPMTSPVQRRGLSRSVPPVSRAVTTLMIGTAAISRPASELGSFRSA
jgi:glucokinase